MWIVIASCLGTPVVLAGLWAFTDRWFPPMLLAILLGIAVAALTYRYLGGPGISEFKVGVLKVAGSAALLLGTAWLANDGLAKQMDVENAHNKLANAYAARDNALKHKAGAEQRAKALEETSRAELTKLTGQLEKAQYYNDTRALDYIKSAAPDSTLGNAVKELAKKRRGPFRNRTFDVNVTVIAIAARNTFYACNALDVSGRELILTAIPASTGATDAHFVTGREGGTIQTAICGDHRRFDMQIGCADGAVLFPESIAGCDKNGAVKWSGDQRVFKVAAEVLDS